jgi:hypothetical protein
MARLAHAFDLRRFITVLYGALHVHVAAWDSGIGLIGF